MIYIIRNKDSHDSFNCLKCRFSKCSEAPSISRRTNLGIDRWISSPMDLWKLKRKAKEHSVCLPVSVLAHHLASSRFNTPGICAGVLVGGWAKMRGEGER